MTSSFLTNVEIHPASKLTKGRVLPKPVPGMVTKTLLSCVKRLPIDQIHSSTRLKNQSFVLFSPTYPKKISDLQSRPTRVTADIGILSAWEKLNREDICWECLIRTLHSLPLAKSFSVPHIWSRQQSMSLPISVQMNYTNPRSFDRNWIDKCCNKLEIFDQHLTGL